MLFAESEDQVAQGRATLDRLSRPLEALLGAFEPEGVAAAESLAERLEASRGRLPACCNTRFIKEHKPSNHIRARIRSHVYTTE